MAKQKAELRVVLERDGRRELVMNLSVQGYDMYVFTHHPLMGGKTSIHESGITHGSRTFLNLREPDRSGVSLKTLDRLRYLTGFGAGEKVGGGVERNLKADTRQRRTLLFPMPPRAWGVDVWAFPPHHTIAREALLTTRPWPEVPLVGTLHADWTNPNILVTVWGGGPLNAYEVVKYEPAVKGYTPFEVFPESYEGTALYRVAHKEPDPFRRAMREWIISERQADRDNSDDGDE